MALVVALGLQIGTNYVNDYADGVRGTDEVRVGPVRLVAGKLATVRQVKIAALLAFGVSGVWPVSSWPSGSRTGSSRSACSAAWPVGRTPVGKHPYGYLGLGELLVFVFFGLVATAGSAYVQHVPYARANAISQLPTSRGPSPSGPACPSVCWRRPSCRPTTCAISRRTRRAGKKTLAVRLGRVRAGYLYVGTLVAAAASIGVLQHYRGWALIALAGAALGVVPARLALSDSNGRALLPMLATTARLQLAVGLLLTVGLLLVRP